MRNVVLTSPQGRFSEAGFMGIRYKPFATGGDPNAARFAVEGIVAPDLSDAQQMQRRELLSRINTLGNTLRDDTSLAVAAESAHFQTPGGKGGLFCHTPMVAVARAVGRKKGLEMALTGDPIDAQTACDWGLVNRVVPDADLVAETADLMRRATRGSAYSKAMGKQSYYAQVDMPQVEAYEYTSSVMSAGVTTADGQEGISSFVEKRRPNWRNS